MKWLILILAGILETFWAVCLKYSQGFTKPLPSVLTLIGMTASFYLLSLSLRELPLGIAYGIWTGIGTIGAVIVGIYFFHETVSLLQVACVLLILIGIIGLKLLAQN
ncbi:MAG: hypothetical protein BGN88_14825 [Clostridiales bacterium 43-6]|nr:MAG: hypothetical protein BGN88_14825 [Clostridiales bacterium 43-6]